MRRALSALVVTAAAVVLLVNFRTSAPGGALRTRPAQTATSPARASGAASRAPTTTTAPPPAGRTGTFTGSLVQTRYGDVEVAVALRAGRITAVGAVALPTDRPRSQFISQQAEPLLRTEALSAQSARIDIVSGATYTSEGYAQSLQAALDRAHA